MLMTCDPNSCDQQGFIDAFNSFQDGAQVSVQGFTGPCQDAQCCTWCARNIIGQFNITALCS